MYCEPPSANLKCIIFTLLLAAGYKFLPQNNNWILASLIYFPYLAMAYYDYWYKCERKLGPTYLSLFYMWAKPYNDAQYKEYSNWCPKYRNRVFMVDVIILLFLGMFTYFKIYLAKELFVIFGAAALMSILANK